MPNDPYSKPFENLGICSNQHASEEISYERWASALARAKAAISTMPEDIKERARIISSEQFRFAHSVDECLDLIADAENFDGFSTGTDSIKKQAAWHLMDVLRKVETELP